jgi:hypothetical protein
MPNGFIVRTVLEATLLDVSPVNYGAYVQATSGVRAALRSAPDAIRAKLNVRDDSGDCEDGQHFDSDLDDCVDNDDDSDWDDRSEDYRCAYRCLRCSERSLQHQTSLSEDDKLARSMQPTKTDPRLSDSEFAAVEAKRCMYRCAEHRAIGHYSTSLQEDDLDARAQKLLLSYRAR